MRAHQSFTKWFGQKPRLNDRIIGDQLNIAELYYRSDDPVVDFWNVSHIRCRLNNVATQ